MASAAGFLTVAPDDEVAVLADNRRLADQIDGCLAKGSESEAELVLLLMRMCFQGHATKQFLGEHRVVDRLLSLAKKASLTTLCL